MKQKAQLIKAVGSIIMLQVSVLTAVSDNRNSHSDKERSKKLMCKTHSVYLLYHHYDQWFILLSCIGMMMNH